MRIIASGNLTVELIRAQRFDVACQLDPQRDHAEPIDRPTQATCEDKPLRIDRVELSPQSLACDLRATPMDRANLAITPIASDTADGSLAQRPTEPQRITPIVGSPALAGLGIALVVPGTLLDVVA